MPSNLVITKVGAPTWLGFLIFCWGIIAASTAAMKTRGTFYASESPCHTLPFLPLPASRYLSALFAGSANQCTSSGLVLTATSGLQLLAEACAWRSALPAGSLRGWMLPRELVPSGTGEPVDCPLYHTEDNSHTAHTKEGSLLWATEKGTVFHTSGQAASRLI